MIYTPAMKRYIGLYEVKYVFQLSDMWHGKSTFAVLTMYLAYFGRTFGRNIRAVSYIPGTYVRVRVRSVTHTRERTRGLCPLLSPCRAVLIRDERVERAIACGHKRATATANSRLRHRYIYVPPLYLLIVPAESVHNVVAIAIHQLTVVCITPHIY